MLVSWDWLSQYVTLEMPVEELTHRLTMSGLNLEAYTRVGGDTVIDLEVTSNRPDCLGHLGVAREIAVLFDRELKIPTGQPKAGTTPTSTAVAVRIDALDLCPQYHARVIRGVKVRPSPQWMQQRLQAVGIACINSVVDITNYVMLEYAQPLHAFDYDMLRGGQIIVRRAKAGETIKAINQKDYSLSPEMCVIADAQRAVAVAGVMGGFDTEISTSTTNVLIESAAFAPLAVRNTARKLDLHSPSSYRFERALDPNGPEWASRRCCELILELAGGELLDGVVSAGSVPVANEPITLRFGQFRKVLGIDIPSEVAVRILEQLGLVFRTLPSVRNTVASEQKVSGTPPPIAHPCQEGARGGGVPDTATFTPPSFRRDLTREIDLIEEVARIYGYDKLPADVVVPLCTSAKTLRERVTERIGETLTALSFFEAMTVSFTSDAERKFFQPLGDVPPLGVEHSSRKQDHLLRQSLIPSLLVSRRANERHGNFNAQLFEIAKVYWKADPELPEREAEPWRIGLVTGRSFQELKGVIDAVAQRISPRAAVTVRESSISQFTPGRGAEVLLNGQPWGWMGELVRSVTDAADLKDAVCVAELDLETLEAVADLVPRASPLPEFPAIVRDLNFVLDEAVEWAALEDAIRQLAGPLLESVTFSGQYRGKQIGDGKKSYLMTLTFRAKDRTLASEEIDAAQKTVIAAVESRLSGHLRV